MRPTGFCIIFLLLEHMITEKKERGESIMKTAKKRILAFLMAVLVVMTTVFGNVDYSVKAEETTKTTWSKV